jgi:BirA family transcriptional regulator, biotin operon repressor / biotin---[acetyl-CoA-carboxylase] ligase
VSGAPSDLERVRDLLTERSCTLGSPLVLLDETTSTNDDAKRAAKAGAPHGATWVAERQTAGRGRQGRAWVAAPGDALLVSVLIRTPCPPAHVPQLALAAGLAARDAVALVVPGVDIGIKWPNDVIVERRKLAGILVEGVSTGSRVDAIVVGIGINVRAFPPEMGERATSIDRLRGSPTDRAALLIELLVALDRDLALVAARGVAAVRARLAAADALLGEVVASDAGAGVAIGIDDEGRLVVRGDDGAIARWSSGEVHLARDVSSRSTTP